jgi:hypothetical protein
MGLPAENPRGMKDGCDKIQEQLSANIESPTRLKVRLDDPQSVPHVASFQTSGLQYL